MNYRTRLLIVSSLAVAASMAVASVVIFLVVRAQLYGQVDTYLRDRGRTAKAAYRFQATQQANGSFGPGTSGTIAAGGAPQGAAAQSQSQPQPQGAAGATPAPAVPSGTGSTVAPATSSATAAASPTGATTSSTGAAAPAASGTTAAAGATATRAPMPGTSASGSPGTPGTPGNPGTPGQPGQPQSGGGGFGPGPNNGGRFMLPGGPAGGAGGVSQLVNSSGVVQKDRPQFSAAEIARRKREAANLPKSLRPKFRDADVTLQVSGATKAVAAGKHGAFLSNQTIKGVDYRIYTIGLGDGHAAQIARPVDEIDRVLHRMVRLLVGVVAGGIVLAVLFGMLVTRTASRPIRRLQLAAERVAAERDLSHRIPTDDAIGSDDLSQLAMRFNDMLAALEQSERSQRQLVEDAEHELRTPLTSLRMNIEVLVRADDRLKGDDRARLMSDLTKQVDELALLVEDLVEMARTGNNDSLPQRVRLDELVADAVDRVRRAYPETHFAVQLHPVEVTGQADQINRAIGNLLANAAKHGGGEGPVEVQLSGNGVVQVRDHGPGIDDDEKTKVFERFYRANDARDKPGSGLGLAIVRRVADAHKGDVWVEDAAGGGSSFHLRLPVEDELLAS